MPCVIPGCLLKVVARGLCHKHYQRAKYNKILPPTTRKLQSDIRLCGNYAEVELTQGLYAKIDIEDILCVSQFKWRFLNGYAASHGPNMYLHQFIIGKAPEGFEIDHENRDKLDCRRDNLRFLTHRKNTLNSSLCDEGGVCFRDRDDYINKWQAYITVFQRQISLGSYATEQEARAVRSNAMAVSQNSSRLEEFKANLAIRNTEELL